MSRQRRLGAIGVVATLILAWMVGATPSMAGQVSNSTGSNTTAQVVWGTGDETGAGHYGGIYGDVESWGTVVGLWENDVVAVMCDNGTPADPSDDWQGTAGTMRFGDGAGSVTIARNLGLASVVGTMTISTIAYDACTDYWELLNTEEGVEVALDLVATSIPENWVDTYHELLAGSYNSHGNMHSQSRYAVGTASLGGEPYVFDSGLISHNHWSDHWNEH
jgi:hypothetical protein